MAKLFSVQCLKHSSAISPVLLFHCRCRAVAHLLLFLPFFPQSIIIQIRSISMAFIVIIIIIIIIFIWFHKRN